MVPAQTDAAPAIVPATDVALTTAVPVAMFLLDVSETTVIFPDAPFAALDFNRTYSVVLATVPLVDVILTEPAKAVPVVLLTSYPVGAVTTISADKPLPETVKLCSAETVPVQLVKGVNVPVVVIAAASLSVIPMIDVPSKTAALIASDKMILKVSKLSKSASSLIVNVIV